MKTNNEKKPRFNFADKRENISGGRRDGNRNENANNRFKRHGDDETPRFNHFNKDRNNQSYNRNNDGEQRQSGYQHKPYGNYNRHENNDERPYKRSYQTDRERNNNYDPNKVYSKKKQFEYKKQYIDYSKPMRLNKFIANSGLCSRREADEYIAAGVISVNGKVVTELGIKIIPNTDRVLFHDQLVRSEKKVYILLNKPKNCVTTSSDPQERLTVMDLVKNACTERVYPVGRLDRNTTGVLLITNDGDLASKMMHPKYNRKKIYEVVLDKDLEQEDLKKIKSGLMLADGEIHADEVEFTKEGVFNQVGIEIHSGRNRIVCRIFEHLGYKVIRLDRVYLAGLTKKNLPRGKWRYLSEEEVNFLKMD